MKKYTVTLEFKVESVDLLDVEVEADSPEQAIIIAEKKYLSGEVENENFYGSDFHESNLDEGNMDVIVEEEE